MHISRKEFLRRAPRSQTLRKIEREMTEGKKEDIAFALDLSALDGVRFWSKGARRRPVSLLGRRPLLAGNVLVALAGRPAVQLFAAGLDAAADLYGRDLAVGDQLVGAAASDPQ
jgi:hypothetical protein